MPFVEAKTKTGAVDFYYNISTPSCSSAKCIVKHLPIILWLHPNYGCSVLYHPQLADPELRKYNLVTFDLRLHGETVTSEPLKTWSLDDAAQDVVCFMDALNLPACHVVGLSLGSSIALTLAHLYPEKVLSLALFSALPLSEPPETAEGREQVADIWIEGVKNNDECAMQDAIWGAVQLAFSNHTSPLFDAILDYNFPCAIRNWGAANVHQYRLVSCEILTSRKAPSRESLSKIRGPILLVHFSDDIAYTLQQTMDIRDVLVDAGCNVKVTQIPDGNHFGTVTHPRAANKILDEYLRSIIPGASELKVPEHPISPYEKVLAKHGLYRDSDSETEP